jgi:hypothetical protein
MPIQRRIGQRRIGRNAILEEMIGRAIGLMDCTPAREFDEACYLIEFVGNT